MDELLDINLVFADDWLDRVNLDKLVIEPCSSNCTCILCRNRPPTCKCTDGCEKDDSCPCFELGIKCGEPCCCTQCSNKVKWEKKGRRSRRSKKRIIVPVWRRKARRFRILKKRIVVPVWRSKGRRSPRLKKVMGWGETLQEQLPKIEFSIARPDDWHLHLGDDLELLKAVLPHSSHLFGRATIMPNLKPPITTAAAAVAYRRSILKALPKDSDFNPLMTLYLTDTTSPNEIKLARETGVVFGVKFYPAGATTKDLFAKCLPVLEEMVQQKMPLLVHGEVTRPDVDIFDREKEFITTVLRPLTQKFPKLKIVMEHITTMDAVNFVESCDKEYVAATVTPQHLALNRNSLAEGGVRPQHFYLPLLKRESHRQALVSAVTSGSKRFFLGTDSAPRERRIRECTCGCAAVYNSPVALSVYAKVFEEVGALDKLEGFTSFNGPDFYGLPRNKSKIKLSKTKWKVPASYGAIVPMFAGETLEWKQDILGT